MGKIQYGKQSTGILGSECTAGQTAPAGLPMYLAEGSSWLLFIFLTFMITISLPPLTPQSLLHRPMALLDMAFLQFFAQRLGCFHTAQSES